MGFTKFHKKIAQTITNKVAGYKIGRLSVSQLSKVKLVMTLLVRDEIDVIRKNIDFHLSQGVDFIVATDNGSVDGTLEVLREYEGRGMLYLIQEPEQTYSQALWVNRMGKVAYEQFGADVVFHCDADEFWKSATGNLKHEICARDNLVALSVRVINVLLKDKGGEEVFPDDAQYCVVKPYETRNLEEDSKHTSMYLFRYPQSVIFNTRGGLLEVGMGNHSILSEKKIKKAWSVDITIYHFPVRGKAHFISKVVNGGSALESNPQLDKKLGWHWRRWYAAYQQGRIDEVYRQMIVNERDAKALIANGVLLEQKPILL